MVLPGRRGNSNFFSWGEVLWPMRQREFDISPSSMLGIRLTEYTEARDIQPVPVPNVRQCSARQRNNNMQNSRSVGVWWTPCRKWAIVR